MINVIFFIALVVLLVMSYFAEQSFQNAVSNAEKVEREIAEHTTQPKESDND